MGESGTTSKDDNAGATEEEAGSGEGAGPCTFDTVSEDPRGANQVSVTVPIRTTSGGSGSKSLRVHRNCAEAIKAVFAQIYDSVDKPAIQSSDTGCYSDRPDANNSRHDWGVACDVNWIENFCILKSGSLCGPSGFWKPGDIAPDNTYVGWSAGFSKLSIPIKSSISSAFFSQGWGRGLWTKKNDFMHYSVDGK